MKVLNNRLNDFTQLGTFAEANYHQKQRVQQPSGQEIGGFSPPQSAQRLIKFLSLSSQINGSIFPFKSFPENVKVSENPYFAEKMSVRVSYKIRVNYIIYFFSYRVTQVLQILLEFGQ